MDPRRQALPPLPPPTPYRPTAYGIPPQPLQRPPPVPYYPVGFAGHPGAPSSASRAHAHTDFEPSPLDPSRRVVQRPSSTYPVPANYNHGVQAVYTSRPQFTLPYGGRYAPSQGSLTPPSPARPLNADPSLFPAVVKQTDILELHNEVMRRGRALDWKDEQVHKEWRSTVLIDNREWSVAYGKTKKDARHKAAKLALPLLRAQP